MVLNIGCIVLAAGASQRFGQPKMLASLADGTPMLLATLAKYQAVFDEVTVVVRPDTELQALLDKNGVKLVHSPKADQGMSQSLIVGVQANINTDACLIALGDMPYIKTDTIARLCGMASSTNICMPIHQGINGNPVIFGKDFYADLLKVSGDQGGKRIIQRCADKLRGLEVDDQGVLQDIDTPAQILPMQ